MISNPRPGQRVRLHYATKPARKGCPTKADYMPHHGALGRVEIAGRGRPRNHGVRLDSGRFVVVPAGNLQRPTL